MTKAAAKVAGETTEKVVEETLDVIEETLDTIERIPRLRLNGTTRTQQIVILGVTAAFGAAIGSAVTYKIVQKKMEIKYEALLSEGIKEARDYYRVLGRKESEDAVEALSKYSGLVEAEKAAEAAAEEGEEDLVVEEEVVVSTVDTFTSPEATGPQVPQTAYNVFSDPAVNAVEMDVEEAKKSRGLPYVLTMEQFMDNEDEYAQLQLTYFAADGVLATEDDMPVEGVEDLVGEANLLMFGRGSGDPNVVFVRNDRTRCEYEIARSNGSYAKEVHDIDPEPEAELRHSARTPRRFRQRDD